MYKCSHLYSLFLFAFVNIYLLPYAHSIDFQVVSPKSCPMPSPFIALREEFIHLLRYRTTEI